MMQKLKIMDWEPLMENLIMALIGFVQLEEEMISEAKATIGEQVQNVTQGENEAEIVKITEESRDKN